MRPRGCAARGSWKKGDRSGHGVDERAQGVVEGLHYLGGGLDGEAAGLDVHQRSGELGGVAAHVGVAFSYADVRGAHGGIDVHEYTSRSEGVGGLKSISAGRMLC